MVGIRNKVLLPSIYQDKILFFGYLAALLFFFLSLILTIISFSQLPPEIPIFYSAKNQILASKNFIWLMPAIIGANLSVNFTVSKTFFLENYFFKRVTVLTSAVVSFLIFWSEFQIISLF